MSKGGNQYPSSLDKVLAADKPFLLVDTDREYLAKLYRRLGFKAGAEIGVGGGDFSLLICQHNPGVRLIAVDLWKAYPGYPDFKDNDYLEADYQKAQDLLKPFNVEFKRKFSMDAIRDVADESLDFVYIDANHLSPWIDNDILWWSRKVKSGGIVSGHDYSYIHGEVVKAVDDYRRASGIYPLFLVGDYAETSNPMKIPSWFWIKP